MKFIVFLAALFLFNNSLRSQDLDNPLVLSNEWTGYSIGDPYVLKHRGIFYLYCSTKDSETGIKCWSSKDLIQWDYEGLCSTDPITRGAYAPEVIYWNGIFYMYTSPAGNGHFVLSSDSPTGPFIPITSNFGKSIDGSVFIDDDASMYFYHASNAGVMGSTMSSPTTFGPSVNINAQMNRTWTEGPTVFKRNQKYYMTYTGNHVISKGYRIDYGTNTTGPIDPYNPAESQNPILINTLGLHVGLGHGSVFKGPDLDSYYLTYHNLVSGSGPYRRLNFDRIAWNGDKMLVLGPTDYPQQNPNLPDAYDYFDRSDIGTDWILPSGGNWSISNEETLVQDLTGNEIFKAILNIDTERNYTAEFNLREGISNEGSKTGVVFGYENEMNYGAVMLNSSSNTLEINTLQNDIWGTPQIIALPMGFDHSKWHCLRIEKFENSHKIFIDDMLKYTLEHANEGGKIGYLSQLAESEYGYIAFSNSVNGSGTFDVFKPVPGKLPAVQYNTGGEGIGYHEVNPTVQQDVILRSDEVELIPAPLGGYALASLESGDWFSYNINVEQSSLYNIEIHYNSDVTNPVIRFNENDVNISEDLELPSTGSEWKSFLIKDVELTVGFNKLKVEDVQGTFHFYSMEIVLADNQPFDELLTFNFNFGSGWKYADGDWEISEQSAFIDGHGKRTYGSEAWRDYIAEADVMFTRSMNAGLIVRVTNPALGGAGNSPSLGTDYLQGYFVGFNFGTIVLGKHNYGWKVLTTSAGSFSLNEWYHLRVHLQGDRIRVFVDDMTNAAIDYIDPNPLIRGMAGFRSFNTGVRFDNFHITSDLLTSDGKQENIQIGTRIFPNPATDQFTLKFNKAETRTINILDMNGKVISAVNSDNSEVEILINKLNPGVYLIQAKSESGIYIEKLIVY